MRDVAEYRKKRQSVSKYEYISTENMLQHYMGITPYADFSNIEGIEYCVGDTLIGNIRPYLKKVWFATFDGACSADVLALKPNYITIERRRPKTGGEKTTLLLGYKLKNEFEDFLA